MLHDQPFEAFHGDGSECNQVVVIKTGGILLIWDQYDDGGFEARGDKSLAQESVEFFGEDIHELVRAVSQDTGREMLSGPGVFVVLILLRDLLTLSLSLDSISTSITKQPKCA